ncbi:MAG: rRNA maturation RNase YbeY [Kiritimatiellae bacterium]|jgi:probable rRNA maturation factor|nr:rRNA maturation RNase YbeY [Kiritimatiellia bacterium]
MIVHLLNRQAICKPDTAAVKRLAAFLMGQAAKKGESRFAELSLLLTDDDGIREIKRQFFDRDRVTDVISFSLRPPPAGGRRRTAEIAVNMEQALREGRKRKGAEREFALYLAHGCNHLAGHDDRTLQEQTSMRRRETRWLKEASALHLLTELFRPARRQRARNTPAGG